MTIPVLIDPVAEDRFRARARLPFEITAEGATREEALGRLRTEIERRMASGATVVPLELLPAQEHPWAHGAGMFEKNPLFDEWQQATSEYRQRVDQEVDVQRLPNGPAHSLDCARSPKGLRDT
jgi:hypothetical protein